MEEQKLTQIFREIDRLTGFINQVTQKLRRHKHIGFEDEKMNNGITIVLMSFETGEQTATKIYFPFPVVIKRIRGQNMKGAAGTDSGTITASNSTGNMTNGVLTVLASALIDTEYSTSPTGDNVRIGKDDYCKLTSAKTTAGGKILVILEWERQ